MVEDKVTRSSLLSNTKSSRRDQGDVGARWLHHATMAEVTSLTKPAETFRLGKPRDIGTVLPGA
jgi:hypothetical protein